METPNIQIIKTDGSDTMPVMAQKINENFQALLNFVVSSYIYAKTDKVVAVAGQTIVSTTGTFVRNSHTLLVFLNGVIQVQNESYTEISASAIKFLFELEEGDEVYLIYNSLHSSVATDEEEVTESNE